jgi:hypothetical protein
MRKYTSAPKSIADAIRDSIPVSEAEALGDDWKKLPSGQGNRSKAGKRVSTNHVHRAAQSKKNAARSLSPKKKPESLEVLIGDVRLTVPGTPSASYAKGLAKAVKDYIKAHPVKA